MASTDQLQRILDLSQRLDRPDDKHPGMPIAAAEWNDLVTVLRGGLDVDRRQEEAALGKPEKLFARHDHQHLGQVSASWLDPELQASSADGGGASLRSELLMARVALIDPELHADVSPEVTARSGMDALCQCIEAFVSTGANPMTDAIALKGIELASNHLLRAYTNVRDLDAREALDLLVEVEARAARDPVVLLRLRRLALLPPTVGLEATEAVLDVAEEADLAHLTVGHDVDAVLDLPAHPVGHGLPHLPVEEVGVVGPPVLPLLHRVEQLGRSGQAARMGREDAFGAALHRDPPDRGLVVSAR